MELTTKIHRRWH